MPRMPQASRANSDESPVACLLHNILDVLDVPDVPSPSFIEATLFSPEWTRPELQSWEVGYADGVKVPWSMLGEEMRFLFRNGLRVYYADLFNPADFLSGGLEYLDQFLPIFREHASFKSGEWTLPLETWTPDAVARWQMRAAIQVEESRQAGFRMIYSQRAFEYSELVEAVRQGGVVRLPWKGHKTWSIQAALAYDVNESGHLMVHTPGNPTVPSHELRPHDVEHDLWMGFSGAAIYWRE